MGVPWAGPQLPQAVPAPAPPEASPATQRRTSVSRVPAQRVSPCNPNKAALGSLWNRPGPFPAELDPGTVPAAPTGEGLQRWLGGFELLKGPDLPLCTDGKTVAQRGAKTSPNHVSSGLFVKCSSWSSSLRGSQESLRYPSEFCEEKDPNKTARAVVDLFRADWQALV